MPSCEVIFLLQTRLTLGGDVLLDVVIAILENHLEFVDGVEFLTDIADMLVGSEIDSIGPSRHLQQRLPVGWSIGDNDLAHGEKVKTDGSIFSSNQDSDGLLIEGHIDLILDLGDRRQTFGEVIGGVIENAHKF